MNGIIETMISSTIYLYDRSSQKFRETASKCSPFSQFTLSVARI